jgi:hypothetical protein
MPAAVVLPLRYRRGARLSPLTARFVFVHDCLELGPGFESDTAGVTAKPLERAA